MHKSLIVEKLIFKAEEELQKVELAYKSSCAYKKSDIMKKESRYDSRAVEASYLEQGQAARVEDLKLELQMLKEIELRDFLKDSEIAVGALVELELNEKIQKYFLCTTRGGTLLEIEGKAVLVISVFSPIGNALIGLKKEDSFELETPKEKKEFYIRSVS